MPLRNRPCTVLALCQPQISLGPWNYLALNRVQDKVGAAMKLMRANPRERMLRIENADA